MHDSVPILLMFGQATHFERGTIFRIINRKTGKCISAAFHCITSVPHQQNCDQMWLLSEIKNGEYEIIQFKTGEVLSLTEGKCEVKLEKGKMKKNNQLWTLEKAEEAKDVSYFWIRPSVNLESLLSASAISEKIKVSTIDQTLQICLWEFLPCVQTSQIFRELSILRSDISKLVIEVPQHSHKEGMPLIQYLCHGGGNQRWIVETYNSQNAGEKQFTVKNYCTGLFLTASFSKMGFKATQTLFNCGPDQRWRLLPTKDRRFLFQSVSNDHYYLGVQNQKGGSQITMTNDQHKARWIIEGYSPAI